MKKTKIYKKLKNEVDSGKKVIYLPLIEFLEYWEIINPQVKFAFKNCGFPFFSFKDSLVYEKKERKKSKEDRECLIFRGIPVIPNV